VQEIGIALALCAVGAAVWYMRRREAGAGRVRGWLLLHDDVGGWRVLPASYGDAGVVRMVSRILRRCRRCARVVN